MKSSSYACIDPSPPAHTFPSECSSNYWKLHSKYFLGQGRRPIQCQTLIRPLFSRLLCIFWTLKSGLPPSLQAVNNSFPACSPGKNISAKRQRRAQGDVEGLTAFPSGPKLKHLTPQSLRSVPRRWVQKGWTSWVGAYLSLSTDPILSAPSPSTSAAHPSLVSWDST